MTKEVASGLNFQLSKKYLSVTAQYYPFQKFILNNYLRMNKIRYLLSKVKFSANSSKNMGLYKLNYKHHSFLYALSLSKKA